MYKTCRRLSSFLPSAFSLASEMWGKREMDIFHGPSEAQPAKQSQTGPQGFCLRKWERWEKRHPSPPPMFKEKRPGNEVGEKSLYNAACLSSFCTAFSSRSIYFGDVPEGNGRETLTSSLGPNDSKRTGSAEQ